MTLFRHGDRIRYATTGDDGFPIARYGFVGGTADDGRDEAHPVMVILDGEIAGEIVELDKIEPVSMSTVTLILAGTDLLNNPTLRYGLVNLWAAEAESAGLQIGTMQSFGTGIEDTEGGYRLAELSSGGESYELRACLCPSDLKAILVRANAPDSYGAA